MKFIFTLLLITALNFFNGGASANPMEITGDDPRAVQIVPNAYAGVTGTAGFLGPLANSQRTYQLLIQASQLTGLVGKNLTGFCMRSLASASTNWPATDVTFTNYDIYLSESVEPAARSLTFANNVVGPQTQVHSGPLTIPANSLPFGSSPNQFGREIPFNIPWFYAGGNLLIEIRHTGFTGTSRSVDAIGTGTPGYLTAFSACWTGNYAGVSGTAGNFAVIKLNSSITLQLEALIEGLYDGATNTMISDTARVYLRNDFAPYDIVDSAVSVLDSNGFGTYKFLNAVNGVNYYIVVDQRNSINTWSATGNSFVNDSLVYDFTTAASQAFGSNQVLEVTRYAMYSGDVNKDGSVDVTDLGLIDNAAFAFMAGYVVEDLNGDLIVDVNDAAICDNNAFNFVVEVRP